MGYLMMSYLGVRIEDVILQFVNMSTIWNKLLTYISKLGSRSLHCLSITYKI